MTFLRPRRPQEDPTDQASESWMEAETDPRQPTPDPASEQWLMDAETDPRQPTPRRGLVESPRPEPAKPTRAACPHCGQAMPDTGDLLRASVQLLGDAGVVSQVVPYFYTVVYAHRQDLIRLFPEDMTGQYDMILTMIITVVRNYGIDTDALLQQLAKAGRAHRALDDPHKSRPVPDGQQRGIYYTTPRDYADIGRALLATIGHFAGEHWTTALQSAWAEAYRVMAKEMLGAELDAYLTDPGDGRRRRT
jgi:hemoglobin-like flavoprotein